MRKHLAIFWLALFSAVLSVPNQTVAQTLSLAEAAAPDSIKTATDLVRTHRDSLLTEGDSVRLERDSVSLGADSPAEVPNEAVSGKKSGLDATVNYKAKDSLVFEMGNIAHLYGSSEVTYNDINLTAEQINMSLDSSLVHAVGTKDTTTGKWKGTPVFKDNSGEYETKQISYNFKTAKGYITDVVTQQGDGYVTGGKTKKMPDNDIFLENGRYTTCDYHECPHFYFQLTKARVRPKKNVVTGPAYLVVSDVPLPIAVPFGFFPFTKSYSSGIIMPTYGAEQERGLYLRDGGYYFAINDYMDLKLTGEIYTKGSWGLAAEQRYAWRYHFKGNWSFSYLKTITGDKGLSDYSEMTNVKAVWSHQQDAKFNPNLTLSASVNFTTSGYERNNLTSYYNSDMTQSTKSSTVNVSYKVPNKPLTISASTSITQRTKDSTLVVTLPDLTIAMNRIYPFKRKVQVGSQRWYEKIAMTYNGRLSNSVTCKQDKFFEQSLVKDWSNGMQHTISIPATFTLFNYINITPSVNFVDRMYTHRTEKYYDPMVENANGTYGGVLSDTTYGFYNAYNFSTSVSLNTKLYGMYTPLWKNSKLVAVRHLFTPTISFSYTPDFSDPVWGSWGEYQVPDESQESGYSTVRYSYFQGYKFGGTSQGKSGSVTFGIANNIEAKIRSDKDSTGYKKISLIDNLTTSISYNLVADSMRWSTTLPVNATFKFSKNTTMNLSATFDNYDYASNGRHIDHFRIGHGQFPRLMNTGYSWSYQLNNEKLAKLFGFGSGSSDDNKKDNLRDGDGDGDEDGVEDDLMDSNRNRSKDKNKKKNEKGTSTYDSDGYLLWQIPWTMNFSYTMRYAYGSFDSEACKYDMKLTHSASISGSIQPTKNWNFSYNLTYDFNESKVTYMNINCTRDLHCWSLTANLNPLGQYASFNVCVAVKSSMLSDFKYEKTSVSRSNKIEWYDD